MEEIRLLHDGIIGSVLVGKALNIQRIIACCRLIEANSPDSMEGSQRSS